MTFVAVRSSKLLKAKYCLDFIEKQVFFIVEIKIRSEFDDVGKCLLLNTHDR